MTKDRSEALFRFNVTAVGVRTAFFVAQPYAVAAAVPTIAVANITRARVDHFARWTAPMAKHLAGTGDTIGCPYQKLYPPAADSDRQ